MKVNVSNFFGAPQAQPSEIVSTCLINQIVRERIACNKAIAIAKRGARERTSKNKASAVAKRAARASKPLIFSIVSSDVDLIFSSGRASVCARLSVAPSINQHQADTVPISAPICNNLFTLGYTQAVDAYESKLPLSVHVTPSSSQALSLPSE